MVKKKVIDASITSLRKWLYLLRNKPANILFDDSHFPNEKAKKECLIKAEKYSQKISNLILSHLLFSTVNFPLSDLMTMKGIVGQLLSKTKGGRKKTIKHIKSNIHLQRLLYYYKVDKQALIWHGIDWTMDLLPNNPQMAIDAIHAYLVAHFVFLPDGRIFSLYDAMAFIRSRYLLKQHPLETLLRLNSRQFEHLIEHLYYSMGYKTKLMKHTRDGGRDVIAKKTTETGQDKLLIQCKRVANKIGFGVITAINGVVASEKATKAVVISTGGFTKPAQHFMKENKNRIELINFTNLCKLFNRYLSPRWPLEIEEYIAESEKRYLP